MPDVERNFQSSRDPDQSRGRGLKSVFNWVRRGNKREHQHSTSRSLTSESIKPGTTQISIARSPTTCTTPVARIGGGNSILPGDGAAEISTSVSSHNSGNTDPIVILLLGLTGAGKSSFIARITKDFSGVGKGLNSETQTTVEYPVTVEGQKYIFIDTPGFNDSGNRSDFDVLRNICAALKVPDHESQIPRKISGVLYLHRITDERMRASSTRVLEYLQELCGSSFMPNVVLLSTHWDLMTGEQEFKKANSRQDQLQRIFWKSMMENGAKAVTFNPTKDNAEHLITEHFRSRLESTKMLAVQKELENSKGQLHDTNVGKIALRQTSKRVLSDKVSSIDSLRGPSEPRIVLPKSDDSMENTQSESMSPPLRTDSGCVLDDGDYFIAKPRSSSLDVQYTAQTPPPSDILLDIPPLQSKENGFTQSKAIPSKEYNPPPCVYSDPTAPATPQSYIFEKVGEITMHEFVAREKPKTLLENIKLQNYFIETQKGLNWKEKELLRRERGLFDRGRELSEAGSEKNYPTRGLQPGSIAERDNLAEKERSLLENDRKSLVNERQLLAMQRKWLERQWEPHKRYLEPSFWGKLE